MSSRLPWILIGSQLPAGVSHWLVRVHWIPSSTFVNFLRSRWNVWVVISPGSEEEVDRTTLSDVRENREWLKRKFHFLLRPEDDPVELNGQGLAGLQGRRDITYPSPCKSTARCERQRYNSSSQRATLDCAGSKQGNDINIPRDGLLPAGTFRGTTTTTTTTAAVNFPVLKPYRREGED